MNKYTHRWYQVKVWCTKEKTDITDMLIGELNQENILHLGDIYEDSGVIYALCFNNEQLENLKTICEFYFNDCTYHITPLKVEKIYE